MSDGFEVIDDTDSEGSYSPEELSGKATSRRKLFQLGAAGVAAVGTAAVANALTASPAGATPGSALLVGDDNTAGSGLTSLTGGNGFGVSTTLGAGASINPVIAVEGTAIGDSTFGSIGVKGTGLAGVQGTSNGSNTTGIAGVQGVGNGSWLPGVEASNAGHPSLYLAPISTTTLPTGGVGNSKPLPGSFIVLSDGTLHYSNAAGKWVALTGPSAFAQGAICMLPGPIRILDTRPLNPAAINKGTPIAGGTAYGLQVTGESVGGVSIPAGAVAVIGNITVVNPAAAGYLTLFPGGASRPTASSINYVVGQVIANGVTVRLSNTGVMDIFAAGTTDVVFDATGFIA